MITSSMEIITPEKAREYLEKNTNNYRKLNKSKVDAYANDIEKGLWCTNGESIVFSADGNLKDGQHRLNAIVKANKSVMILVVRGVDNDVNIFDWGMERTNMQIAKASGYTVSTSMIGAVRILLSGFHGASSKASINKYIMDHYDDLRNASFMAMRGAGSSTRIGKKASCCLAVYCVRRLNLISDEILEDFFYVFNNQCTHKDQMRDPSAPLIAARIFVNKLIGGSSITQKKQVSVIMQAMDDYKKNKSRRTEYRYENDKITGYRLNQLRQLDGIPEIDF